MPSPDHPPRPDSNAALLQQHRRGRSQQSSGKAQAKGRRTAKYESGQGDPHGERVASIYPRELNTSPPRTAQQPPPASPNLPTSFSPASSPLLSTITPIANTAAQYTSEWTRSLPFNTGQQPPGNGVIIGGSPPNHGPPRAAAEGGFSHAPMSTSPPNAGSRPMSHPTPYPTFGGRMQSPSAPPGNRRASMYSQYGGRPSFSGHPPLPHQPQPHFYGLPDLDLGLRTGKVAEEGLKPGEGDYVCGFDSLATAGDDHSLPAEDVLLVGYEGGLDVMRVRRDRLDVLGRLDGLRGSVIGAKIIPWTARTDPHASKRPLVALVIHGPVLRDPVDDAASPAVTDDNGSQHDLLGPPSRSGDESRPEITHYQTTVQVYSLSTQEHVATLYTAPPVALTGSPASPLFQPPEPVGDLKIDANGKVVVVACGTSGEVFIFTQASNSSSENREGFHCIGKVWTSLHYPERRPVSSASSSTDVSSQSGDAPPQRGVPLIALSPRTLVVVPPASSSHFSLNGTALLSPSNPRPPGLTLHTAPPPPAANCGVETPEGDGLFNRMARDLTQEFLKGARWVGDQGMQAWKNYWNKPSPPDTLPPHVNDMNYAHGPLAQQAQFFPPTHGHATTPPQAHAEPVLVSILDLQRLVVAPDTKLRNALTPLATFPAPLGCSFLSFAPSGLSLLTASKKGDFQFVWDLMRMCHGRPALSANGTPTSPHVRQIARFTRMTVANIVDVIWTTPKGDRLAVLTEKGTIHVFELPSSAFQWPPPRRVRQPDDVKRGGENDGLEDPSAGKGGAVTSAIQAINGKTMPLLNAVRSRSRSGAAGFPTISGLAMTSAGGAKGAVASGVSKSIGAATTSMTQLYHARDNKLHLHHTGHGVSPGCIRWLNGKERGSIALVAGGVLRIHAVKQRVPSGKGKPPAPHALVSKIKSIEFGLQSIPASLFPAAILAQLDGRARSGADAKADGYWTLRGPDGAEPRARHRPPHAHPLSYAELETNAPYQPFHTDRRISLHAYADLPPAPTRREEWDPVPPPLDDDDPHHVRDGAAWVFGGAIATTRVAVGAVDGGGGSGSGEDEFAGEFGGGGGTENLVLRERGAEAEQVVVTTRRRKVRRPGEGEEGFFEDDCEVLDFAADRV